MSELVSKWLTTSTGCTGVRSWLFEGLVRQKAEALLQLPCNASGSFMVRESTSERGEAPPRVTHAFRVARRPPASAHTGPSGSSVRHQNQSGTPHAFLVAKRPQNADASPVLTLGGLLFLILVD